MTTLSSFIATTFSVSPSSQTSFNQLLANHDDMLSVQVNQMFRNKLIVQVFPVHDSSELNDLEREWYKSGTSWLKFLKKIPLGKQDIQLGISIF